MSDRAARAGKAILVADDSETYRSVAARVLGAAGYQVNEAGDGAQALEKLRQAAGSIDLLVLELNLPKVRGIDVLRRLRGNPETAGVKVLVVSDSMTAHLRQVLEDLQMDAHLSKNHALRELLYQVDALLFPALSNQRRSERHLLSVPVNYWVDDVLYLQTCFNVSDEGMFVVVSDEDPPPVGTRLALRFWLPTSERLIVCDGEVKWRNTAGGDLADTHPPGMGIRFTRIAAADVATIHGFLAEPR